VILTKISVCKIGVHCSVKVILYIKHVYGGDGHIFPSFVAYFCTVKDSYNDMYIVLKDLVQWGW